jgi:hypothetical protein
MLQSSGEEEGEEASSSSLWLSQSDRTLVVRGRMYSANTSLCRRNGMEVVCDVRVSSMSIVRSSMIAGPERGTHVLGVRNPFLLKLPKISDGRYAEVVI